MKTEMDQSRYKKALFRNLNEVGTAILERRAMVGIEKGRNHHHGMDFIRIANDAMFNDMIAHAIKLFEDDRRVASFWYIKRCKEKEISDFVCRNEIDMSKLEKIKAKLKRVRDGAHFHIDRDAVKDSKRIWDEAKITGRELAEAIDVALRILDHLYVLDRGSNFYIPRYKGSDATKITKYANTL